MAKLINFTKHVLKNYTYLELMQTITERLSGALAVITQPAVKDAVTAFTAAVSAMDADYKRATGSVLTSDLADADHARDLAYGSLSAVVTAMQTAGVKSLEDAAKELKTVLRTFKVNTSAQINEESGAILQLCQELDKHTAALATLSLTEVYAEMKRQNEAVRTTLKQRNEEQAFDELAVMKKHRAIVDAKYDTLMDALNAALFLGNAQLEQTVTIINADINYVKRHNGLTTSDTGDLPEAPEGSGTTDNGTGNNQSGTGSGTTPTPNPGDNGGVLE